MPYISTPVIFFIAFCFAQIHGLLSPLRSYVKASTSSASRYSLFASNDWIIDHDDSRRLHEQDDSQPRDKSIINDKTNDMNNIENVRAYFATCIPGLHNVLSYELDALGATNIEAKSNSGVSFTASPTVGLKSILWCRSAHRIMELISSSEDEYYDGIRNSRELYDFIKSLHTPSLLGDGKGGLLTFSVSTIYTSRVPKDLCHSHYTALTVKNALVDDVRELREDGSRPDVNTIDPDLPFVVVLRGRNLAGSSRGYNRRSDDDRSNDEDLVADVDIYRCLHSSGSLHRRGYRSSTDDYDTTPIHRAAMKESLAAGLLMEAGWDKLISAAKLDGLKAVLIDPMTGSGTLPTEAAMIACDMAPGLSRIATYSGSGRNPHSVPPAVRWKEEDFNIKYVWNELLNEAASRAKNGTNWARSNVVIQCNEKNDRAVTLAASSIKNLGAVGSIITLNEGDCLDWTLHKEVVIPGRSIFVCNPPWGIRLTDDIDASWVSLRGFLRREASGSEAWVLSGNKDLTKILRMKNSRKVVVKTADENLRWLQYHIFQRKDDLVDETEQIRVT